MDIWFWCLLIGIVLGSTFTLIGGIRHTFEQSDRIDRLKEALAKIYWESEEPRTWEIAEKALDRENK